jgi:hypothetical protein
MSMLKLNRLLSGNLDGLYGDISLDKTLEFCEKSGLDKKYTIYDPDYDKKDIYQHGKSLKEDDPINPPV